MHELLKEYVRLLFENWEEQYQVSNKDNLMLDKPGHIVEPDVRSSIAKYLKKMKMMGGKKPHPKGPRRKAIKV